MKLFFAADWHFLSKKDDLIGDNVLLECNDVLILTSKYKIVNKYVSSIEMFNLTQQNFCYIELSTDLFVDLYFSKNKTINEIAETLFSVDIIFRKVEL